jgi:O-antigen/teichoic acid export membrane protein
MVFLQRIKELVTLGSGDVIGSVLSAIFWFYLASQIKPDAYGEIHWFLGIAGFFSYMAMFGTLNTITVYTAKNIKIQSTLYLISLIASIVLSLIVIIIFPGFYEIDPAVILIAYVINTLAVGDLLGRKLYSTYSKYVLVQKGLTLGLGLIFFYSFGYESILFALGLSYVFYIKRIYMVFRTQKINFNLVKERLGFITNNYIMLNVVLLNGQIDKIIIGPLLGFTLLGNYSLALQGLIILLMFSNIFYKYILPQDSSKKNTGNLKIFSILVSIPISLVGIFLGPILIEEFFPKYIETINAIQIMSIVVVPTIIALIFESQFLGSEKSRVVLIGNAISTVILISGMIVLGLNFGIIGLAWSWVLATCAKTVFFAIAYYKNKNGMDYVRT